MSRSKVDQAKVDTLRSPESKIEECLKLKAGYPKNHGQVKKINKQIERLRK